MCVCFEWGWLQRPSLILIHICEFATRQWIAFRHQIKPAWGCELCIWNAFLPIDLDSHLISSIRSILPQFECKCKSFYFLPLLAHFPNQYQLIIQQTKRQNLNHTFYSYKHLHILEYYKLQHVMHIYLCIADVNGFWCYLSSFDEMYPRINCIWMIVTFWKECRFIPWDFVTIRFVSYSNEIHMYFESSWIISRFDSVFFLSYRRNLYVKSCWQYHKFIRWQHNGIYNDNLFCDCSIQ